MDLIQESFQRLFPEKQFSYQTYLEYNRRLSPFNANIRQRGDLVAVNLNLQWKDIDNEIKIGLIQSLLLKILKTKKNTSNIDLYNNFIKNIPLLTPLTKTDSLLEASFKRVNQHFFENQLPQPNLTWGQPSFRKLASYNFHSDTVTVSTLFRSAKLEILDYLMYHELLHKKHQFHHHNGRSSFHTREFREEEHHYPNFEEMEKEIAVITKNTRRSSSFWDFFR